MSTKIVLLFCIISCSKEILPRVNSFSISNIVTTAIEVIHQLYELNTDIIKVRTRAELEENKFAVLDFIGLVQQYDGYKAEEYDVQTEDGYILKMHRIISSPLSSKASNKPVVFMQHGLLGCSDIFVNLGPSNDLAFLLADAGYDIWMGNTRGNTYSKRHIKYSPASNNYNFWNFNIDDLALKDARTFIDATLEKTNKTKLIYIGHSMGTTTNFMLLSSKLEYNDKIDLSINLSPVAYFTESSNLFIKASIALRVLLEPLFRALRIYEALPQTKQMVAFSKTVCTNFIGKYLCGLILSPVLSLQNMNFKKISLITDIIVNGASLDVFNHFFQLLRTEEFKMFDFGPLLNNKIYNSSQPPEYDLSKVTSPQVIFYSDSDIVISTEAAKKDKNELPNVVSFIKAPESYNHYDYVWAKDARIEIYYKILNLIKKFS